MTEGEEWAREALLRLRSEGYSPGAVGRFLAGSRDRARQTREQRPDLERQVRRWVLVGALAWLAPAAARLEPLRGRLAIGLAWWSGAALMLRWHLGMFETEEGEPRPLGPADALTLTRVWLVPLAAQDARPWVHVLGFGSDALDGPIARRTAPTRAGRDLEALADLAFTLAALRGASRSGSLGAGPAAAEATRLLGGLGAAWATYLVRGGPPDRAEVTAARASAPVRAAGLLAAALGRRRSANLLVTAGSAAAVATWVGGRYARRR